MNDKRKISQFLQWELGKRQQKNPSYSLRAFARDLDISPSTLSCILREKQNISKQLESQLRQKLQTTAKYTIENAEEEVGLPANWQQLDRTSVTFFLKQETALRLIDLIKRITYESVDHYSSWESELSTTPFRLTLNIEGQSIETN